MFDFELNDRVVQWALANVADEYHFHAPYTYWGSALRAGIITQAEYERGRDMKGRMWDYVGD